MTNLSDPGLQSSPLENLPIELRQLILVALPDVASLRSAALTCWSMYEALIGAERLITTQVLAAELNPDTLQLSLVAEAARHDVPWAQEEAQAFSTTHLTNIESTLVPKF